MSKKNNSTLPLLSFLFVERDYKTQLFQYPNEATIGFHVVHVILSYDAHRKPQLFN